jgi:anti-anti-sigma regulatory factor
VARLVSLNKRLRSAGNSLAVCGLRPVVREVFHRLRLATILTIADSEEAALGVTPAAQS